MKPAPKKKPCRKKPDIGLLARIKRLEKWARRYARGWNDPKLRDDDDIDGT